MPFLSLVAILNWGSHSVPEQILLPSSSAIPPKHGIAILTMGNKVFFPEIDLARFVLYKKFGILYADINGQPGDDFKAGTARQFEDPIWEKMR